MTMRERMLGVYHGKVQDTPVVGIYSRYLPRGAVERAVRNSGLGIIDYIPLTSQAGPPWHMLPGFLSQVQDCEMTSRYHWDGGHMRERRTYETPVGTVWSDIGKSKGAGSEHISAYYIKAVDDYRVMKHIVENAVLTSNNEMFCQAEEALGDDGVIMGRMDRTPYQKLLLELAGGERFLTDLYDDPEPVEELMDAMAVRYREQVNRAMESAASIIWIPDNVTVDMTPPRYFEKYLLDLYKYCVQCAHQAGKIVVAHFDGKVKPLVPLIRQAGMDVLESVSSPVIGGDMTYGQWREAFPDKVILPNFPSNLCTAPDEEIIATIGQLKQEAAGMPFMLQISEDLAEGTWRRVIPLVTRAMVG